MLDFYKGSYWFFLNWKNAILLLLQNDLACSVKSTIPHRLIDSGVKNGSVLVKYDRFNDKVVSLL